MSGTSSTRSSSPSSSPSSGHVEPWLREVLRCPACRSRLLDVTGPDGAGLRCAADAADGCGRTYRFERGVPVLLVEEGVLPGPEGGTDRPGTP